MGKIYVWIKEPDKKPRHVYISPSLKNLQDTVGGYIENYALSPAAGILCNEEGKLLGLPYNCSIEGQDFVGTIIFIGYAGEDFVDCPFTVEQMKEYYPQLWEVK